MPIRGPVCLPFDTDAGIEWQPVCTSDELADLPKKVKLLCEELVVFRDRRAASERSSPTAIRAPAELCGLARHVDALPLRVVEPAMITAAQPVLLDAAPFERGAAARAVGLERSDAALLVAEDYELLAEQLHLLWQIGELIRGAHRLPLAAHKLTHRGFLARRRSAHSPVAVSAFRKPISSLPPILYGSLPCRWVGADDHAEAYPLGTLNAPRV